MLQIALIFQRGYRLVIRGKFQVISVKPYCNNIRNNTSPNIYIWYEIMNYFTKVLETSGKNYSEKQVIHLNHELSEVNEGGGGNSTSIIRCFEF
jgi:hypothetical protein